MPIAVEQQIVRLDARTVRFSINGVRAVVTGTSMANFIALLVARTAALGIEARTDGLAGAHAFAPIRRLPPMLSRQGLRYGRFGFGRAPKKSRSIVSTKSISTPFHMPLLETALMVCALFWSLARPARSIRVPLMTWLRSPSCAGKRTSPSISTGICGIGMMSPEIAPRLAGIERADSIAFDFHKWAQVPYDAGFVLCATAYFTATPSRLRLQYLQRAPRGLAAGAVWPSDYGPDLSRGFRALKTWFTLKTFGADRLGAMMGANVRVGALSRKSCADRT